MGLVVQASLAAGQQNMALAMLKTGLLIRLGKAASVLLDEEAQIKWQRTMYTPLFVRPFWGPFWSQFWNHLLAHGHHLVDSTDVDHILSLHQPHKKKNSFISNMIISTWAQQEK